MKILIDTDWFEVIKDLSVEKQQEVLTAILNYPNGQSDTNIWKKVIFPALEKGRIGYFNKINHLKQFQQSVSDTVTDTDTATVSDTRTERKENKVNNNKNNINNNNTTREENKTKVHNALEVFGNAFKGTDAVVGIFDRPDGSQREGIQIKNPRLMAFVRHRFDKETLSKVSDWAIDHNQRGHTYNATALIKLLCKFQSNIEPTINFNHVQSEYLTFEPNNQRN